MSAFNTISFEYVDSLGDSIELRVQFKYGDTWQHEYRVGDYLKWGGNDIGTMGAKRVVVDACLDGESPRPGIPEDFVVFVENGVLKKVDVNEGAFDFVGLKEAYIVLED